jgi:8-oxo-dGTP diphosphatase
MTSLRRVCVAYLVRTVDGRDQVLLGRKKRGLGTGLIVGLGGKFEPGETAVEAIVREIEEESGVVVDPADLEHRGGLRYLFPHREPWSQHSTVFVVRSWRGEPRPSDELDPEWFDVDALPLESMWDDAKAWLPGVLAGGQIAREFVFADDLATVASTRSLEPQSL